MLRVPLAPDPMPPDLLALLDQIGYAWHRSSDRVKVDPKVAKHWDNLIAWWAREEDLPLLVRKHRRNRGSEVRLASGRIAILCDNSPAHWVFTNAYEGFCPDQNTLRELLNNDEVPVAMMFTREERELAKHTCLLGDYGVGTAGWKLAHALGIGLNTSTPLHEASERTLARHFARFLAPKNMFVVPSHWASLAENTTFARHFFPTLLKPAG